MAHPKDRPRPIDRRAFLQRAAAAGIALPSMAAILAACGDSGSSGGDASASAALQLARPDNPVTLPISADNPAIADGLDAGVGATEDLRLQRLHLEEGPQRVRRTVRRRRGVHGVRHARRDGRRRCSPTAPTSTLVVHRDAREHRQARTGQAASSRSTRPTSPPPPTSCRRGSRTSTTWAASTRCPTSIYTTGHRVAQRRGQRGHRGAWTTRRTCSGTRSTRARPTC